MMIGVRVVWCYVSAMAAVAKQESEYIFKENYNTQSKVEEATRAGGGGGGDEANLVVW